jgi:DNA-binding CsgD family transcriptional regulator/PAS domain-containing protein
MERTDKELTRLSELIGLIYEGATAPSRWTNDILPAVSEYMQSPASILYTNFHTPQNGGYFFLHGITQEHVDVYTHKYYDQDIWKITFAEKSLLKTGEVVIGEDVVPREQLLASRFYKDCLSLNQNMVQIISGFIFGMDSIHSMPAVCSFFRGAHHPDFDEADRLRMHLVLPHLSRSLGVMQLLRSAELTVVSTLAALECLPSGVLLLNDDGGVVFANRSARRMLEKGDGLCLLKLADSVGLGNLVAKDVAASKAIDDLISATLNDDPYETPHFSSCVTVPRTSGAASYTLQFSALGEHVEFGAKDVAFAAIVFIVDGAQEVHVDPALLQSTYGLTTAEAMVAVNLLDASSAKEVASRLGTSPNTVRTQIGQIYAKLGVDTRTRFVKLMMGLATNR